MEFEVPPPRLIKGRFVDPHGSPPKSLGTLLRWRFGSSPNAKWPDNLPSPFHGAKPPAHVYGEALRVTLIGHASFLIQTAGLNILVDPVYGTRASPLTFAGPKRVNPPGVAFDDLPAIDLLLISHNHYDHLDGPLIARITRRDNPLCLAPLGNAALLHRYAPSLRVVSLNWWENHALGPINIHAVPARHWSARSATDRNKALWCAFVLETPFGLIKHIADTGYGEGLHARAVRERFGPFKLAILPIGAYEPRWFMNDQHVNPEEAVQLFRILEAENAIGHHWGTFKLTNEAIDAPLLALAEALEAAGIAQERFQPFRPGQSFSA